MGENRSEILAANHNGVKNVDIVQAKRKRMMLSEVYVHKSRKLDTDPSKDDHFDVFHIYEFDDNESINKITPKLSTNCTEPRKIIEVLQNSTGSDTPQLQRLIEKLCAQNKKWTENQNNKQTNSIAANVTNGSKVTSVESISQPTTSANNTVSAVSVDPAVTVACSSAAASSNPPVIRVKAIESMKEINQPNVTYPPKSVYVQKTVNQSTPVPITSQASSVQRVNQPVPAQRMGLPTLRPSAISKNRTEPSDNPVKLWNNVMQKNHTAKDLDYLVVANKEDANIDESVFCLKPTEEVIRDATENSSLLKIDQVYECVSEEFVEDLLIEKRPTSASPLLDTLVKEVVDNHNRPVGTKKNMQPSKSDVPTTIIPTSTDKCTDFRCNMCLDFNDTFDEYKRHMYRKHQYNYICEKCHDVFRTRHLFDNHLDPTSQMCTNAENARRTFICIVDPPVILMKNNKVFAFRCKHCSVAFHNQRNYVQHAQRHAKLFRCKLCQSAKALSVVAMQNHLNQHKHFNQH